MRLLTVQRKGSQDCRARRSNGGTPQGTNIIILGRFAGAFLHEMGHFRRKGGLITDLAALEFSRIRRRILEVEKRHIHVFQGNFVHH